MSFIVDPTVFRQDINLLDQLERWITGVGYKPQLKRIRGDITMAYNLSSLIHPNPNTLPENLYRNP